MAVSHLGPGAHYVEGWVVTHRSDPYVIEHGWCEVDGRVVDPSYAPHVTPYSPPVAYFAGMRFSIAEAEAALCARRLPIAWSREHDTYRHAFEAAWRMATHRQQPAPAVPARVVHCRREPYDVMIARPSPWAGPFYFGRDGSRERVIAKYRRWLIRQPGLLSDVWNLRGKVLGCQCAPLPCHGDVLVALANVGVDGAPVESAAARSSASPITVPRSAPFPHPVSPPDSPGLRLTHVNGSGLGTSDSLLE